MKNYSPRVNKKYVDEKMQDLRNPRHDKIKYRRRRQDELEFDKYLEEELKKIGTDNDSLPEVP